MAKTISGKTKIAAVAAAACLCAAIVAVPAYAFWYVHNDADTAVEKDNQGAYEICCTLDETAVGGGVYTELIYIPEGDTAETCLNEMIIYGSDDSSIENIKDHGYQSLGDYLTEQGYEYTVSVYAAGTQEPGTQTTYDTESIGDITYVLGRYDNVVFTVTA